MKYMGGIATDVFDSFYGVNSIEKNVGPTLAGNLGFTNRG